jgi:hypothetical protein
LRFIVNPIYVAVHIRRHPHAGYVAPALAVIFSSQNSILSKHSNRLPCARLLRRLDSHNFVVALAAPVTMLAFSVNFGQHCEAVQRDVFHDWTNQRPVTFAFHVIAGPLLTCCGLECVFHYYVVRVLGKVAQCTG